MFEDDEMNKRKFFILQVRERLPSLSNPCDYRQPGLRLVPPPSPSPSGEISDRGWHLSRDQNPIFSDLGSVYPESMPKVANRGFKPRKSIVFCEIFLLFVSDVVVWFLDVEGSVCKGSEREKSRA